MGVHGQTDHGGVSVTAVPGGFVPEEDQGYFLVNVQLPDAASLELAVKISDPPYLIPGQENII